MIEWNIKRRYRAFAWLAANIKFSTEVLYPRLAKSKCPIGIFFINLMSKHCANVVQATV